MKVVVNRSFGGFGLSPRAINEYLTSIGKDCFFYSDDYRTRKFNKIDGHTSNGWFSVTTKCVGNEVDDKTFYKLTEGHRFFDFEIDRTDKYLISVVETLGESANGDCAKLEVVEIPDDIEWEIHEYDGRESIHEKHRSW